MEFEHHRARECFVLNRDGAWWIYIITPCGAAWPLHPSYHRKGDARLVMRYLGYIELSEDVITPTHAAGVRSIIKMRRL
jgi:hypothetical protein